MKVREGRVLWWASLLSSIPGAIGEACRRRGSGTRLGKGVRLAQHVVIYGARSLSVATNSVIAVGCQLNAKAGIEIGSNVLIGPGCFIWAQKHCYSDATVPIRLQGYQFLGVKIEDDVWIAAACVILPGVTIGRGSVVAAGSVVTKSVALFTVAAGVPAQPIGRREG